MNQVKVSVITVCYNCHDTLPKTIESVLGQTYDNIEYIIIDGLSTDKTVDVAEGYRARLLAKGYSVIIQSEEDNGIYDAMNKGISIAGGELIGFLNSGDWYEPEAIEKVTNTYQDIGFDMFYADLRIFKRTGIMIKHARLRKYITTRDWNHPTTFITRKIYNRYRYACKGIYDDWDLVLRIRRAGYKIVILNEILANFRFGGISNQKNLKKAMGRGIERYRIYRENGYSRLYLFECVAMEAIKYLLA